MTRRRKIAMYLACYTFMAVIAATNAFAAIINAASASYSDVASAVSSARSGDTVVVPAGSATWSSVLTITKGITLRGAGVGYTTITGNVGSSAYLIVYRPSNPILNEAFRLTGFTIDLNNNSGALRLQNTSASYRLSNLRIDHNSFENCIMVTMEINGPIYGVMDSNTFSGTVHIDNYGKNAISDWSIPAFALGSANNFYIEDNLFTGDNTFYSGGHGGRYVARYNTYTYNNPVAGLHPWFDMHGNQPPACNVIGPEGVGKFTEIK